MPGNQPMADKRSELYNDASRDPALFILCLIVELSHEPICLEQTNSETFSKAEVQPPANQHGEGGGVYAPA
jgi:hypothetical protein